MATFNSAKIRDARRAPLDDHDTDEVGVPRGLEPVSDLDHDPVIPDAVTECYWVTLYRETPGFRVAFHIEHVQDRIWRYRVSAVPNIRYDHDGGNGWLTFSDGWATLNTETAFSFGDKKVVYEVCRAVVYLHNNAPSLDVCEEILAELEDFDWVQHPLFDEFDRRVATFLAAQSA